MFLRFSWMFLASAAALAGGFAAAEAPPGDTPAKETAAVAEFDNRAQLVLDTSGFSSRVTAMAFSPDGRLLAAAGEKVVRIWDVQTGELQTTLRGQQQRDNMGNCYAVTFSPDGEELVVGIDDYGEHGSLRVYNVSRLDAVQELVAGHGVAVRHLAFSRDGRFLASAGDDGKIITWDWPWRRQLTAFTAGDADQPIYYFLSFPTAKPIVMVGGAAGPRLFDARTGHALGADDQLPRKLRQFMGHVEQLDLPYGAQIFEFSDLRLDGGFWLASGRGQENERPKYWSALWRSGQTRPAAQFAGHQYFVSSVALSADGKLAASADAFGDIYVWETATGRLRHSFKSLGKPIYAAVYNDAEKAVSFGTQPFPFGKWRRNFFGDTHRSFRLATRALADQPVDGRKEAVLEIGNRQLTLSAESNRWVFDYLRDGRQVSQYWFTNDRSPLCFGMLRSQKLGFADPFYITDDVNGILCLEPTPGQARERRSFSGHQSLVTGAVESADGRFLATCSTDRTVRLWSLQNLRAWGDVDFKLLSDNVIDVPDGSFGAAAGVQVGDVLRSVGGFDLQQLQTMRLQ